MASNHLTPALVIPFIAWRVYARVRRNVGKQRVRRGRMIATIVVFSLVSMAIGLLAEVYFRSLIALGGGLLAGLPLATAGLHLTRFEKTTDGDFYIPNTYIGLVLTLLFVGRMIYRGSILIVVPSAGEPPPPALFQSPLTLLMFGVAAGYYIAYYAGVLAHVRKMDRAGDVDPTRVTPR